MKKIGSILIIIVLIASCALLVGCGAKKTELDMVKDKISYVQTGLYAGKNDSFNVCLSIGKNEGMFIADGKSGNLENFCKLSLKPMKVDMLAKTFTYKITGEAGTVSGEFKKEVLGNNLVSEIKDIAKVGKIKDIDIVFDDKTDKVVLENKMTGMTWDTALQIAFDNDKESIMKDIVDKVYCKEVYIKFINDITNGNSYYWYVAFIASNEKYTAILIDPLTSKILTKKSL
ncbi:MAG: hypothetical protein RR454_07430 [Clostridia bacterium]